MRLLYPNAFGRQAARQLFGRAKRFVRSVPLHVAASDMLTPHEEYGLHVCALRNLVSCLRNI